MACALSVCGQKGFQIDYSARFQYNAGLSLNCLSRKPLRRFTPLRWSLFLLLVGVMSAGCQTNSGTRQAYVPTVPTQLMAERRSSSKSKPTALENRLFGDDATERVGAAVILLARPDRKSRDLVRRHLKDPGSELARSALIEAIRIDPVDRFFDNLAAPSAGWFEIDRIAIY